MKANKRLLQELPTLALLALTHGGIFALVIYNPSPFLFVPCAILLTTLYMSLQHELIHGHPTSSPKFNAMLAMPPYAVFYPYPIFRADHLQHHKSNLTHPMEDPESFFFTQQQWNAKPKIIRNLLVSHNTLIARLLLAPPRTALLLLLRAKRDILHPTSPSTKKSSEKFGAPKQHWLAHAALLTLWFLWLMQNGISPWFWILAIAWPSNSLIQLRSFAEHRAEESPKQRTVTTLSPGLFSLLFLNNNFHITHHKHPSLVWWRIPAKWRAEYNNTEVVIRGYRQILKQWWRVPVLPQPTWPLENRQKQTIPPTPPQKLRLQKTKPPYTHIMCPGSSVGRAHD
ncbi:MAG: fatty acid desaturase [Alphaproteobacteria bacterium]